jgi:hypothetical protein
MPDLGDYPLDKVRGEFQDWEATPFRLWSLLEMLEIYAPALLAISARLEEMASGANVIALERADLPEELRVKWLGELGHVVRHCKVLQLHVAAAIAERMIGTYDKQCNCKKFYADVKSLQEVFRHEIDGYIFLHVPKHRADFYIKQTLFGQEVADKFPSVNFDVEEAGKCFSLGRNTACVMHLMRVMEVGLKAVGIALGIPDPDKANWQTILNQINSQIAQRNATKTPDWLAVEPFFSEVSAHLSTVKTAWRNPSMHADKTYDEERAEDIFSSIKGFMRHLAKRLDESGQFAP